MIIDLRQEIRESRDAELLGRILRMLIGLPCLKLELSYGDELTIHFGHPLPYNHPRLADEFKGAWVLALRGSQWTLSLPDPPCLIQSEGLSTDSTEEAQEKFGHMVGAEVLDVFTAKKWLPGQNAPGHSLNVGFKNGAHFSVFPTEDPENTQLPDWELFTPYDTYLVVGPGDVWSYLSSDSES